MSNIANKKISNAAPATTEFGVLVRHVDILSVSIVGGGGGGGVNISAGTQLATSGTVIFSNSNGVTFGMSDSSVITASVAAGGGGITNINISAGTTSNNLSNLVFSNSNGVSFGLDGSTITANHNGLTSQSNQAASAANGSFAFQTLSFSNLNGISFGTSVGSAITASHNALTVQTNQTLGLYAVGNTTGESSSSTFDARTLSFIGQGIASVGFSNGSVNISVPTGAPSPVNFSAGTTSGNLASVVFSNSNNVSFGLNGATITATASVASTQGSINISAGTTSNLASAFTFSNSNGISFGLNASTVTASVATSLTAINLSAGTTSNNSSAFTFSNANGVTFGLDAGTITASVAAAGGGITYSGYDPLGLGVERLTAQKGQGTYYIQPMLAPAFQFDQFVLLINNTNSSNSSGSHTLSFFIGIYTRNVSTLSLSISSSFTTAITHSGTAGSYSLYSGPRNLTFGWTNTLPASNYWIGIGSRTTSGGADGSYSQFVGSNINSAFPANFGQASNSSRQPVLGQGDFSATTAGIPGSVAFSNILGTAAAALRPVIFHFGSATI